jgi:predicted DNA-binding transcriptional regulator AlpA
LVTAKKAASSLDISMATFWRRVADGTLPKPIKIGGLSRWIPCELAAVIERAKENRDT